MFLRFENDSPSKNETTKNLHEKDETDNWKNRWIQIQSQISEFGPLSWAFPILKDQY